MSDNLVIRAGVHDSFGMHPATGKVLTGSPPRHFPFLHISFRVVSKLNGPRCFQHRDVRMYYK